MIKEIYDAFLSCNQQVTTDTRNIAKNDLFFALKGPNFNGNKFAEKALELGAKYAVIDESKYFIERVFLNWSSGPARILAATVGIKVTEIKTEINTDTEIAIPISLNNCPIGRSNSKIGMNTTTVVKAEPSIGAHTCLEPL